jgi:hypothetical protein
MTAQQDIHAKQPSPTLAMTAGSSKGEDHDPNLENLRRLNRPPPVTSTASPVARGYTVKRQSDGHHVAGHLSSREKMGGRGRGAGLSTRKDVQSHFLQMPDRYRSSGRQTPNGPKQVVATSRNNEGPKSDMEIGGIDAFSRSPSSTSVSQFEAEKQSKPTHLLNSGSTPFLQRNAVSLSAKYLSSVPNLSDDNQTPIHSFSIPQPQHHPRNANPSGMVRTPVKRLSEQPPHSEVPAKRKCSSILEDMGGVSGSKGFSSTEMRSAHQLPPRPHSLRPHLGLSAFAPAGSNRKDIKHTATVRREQDENSDGHDEHPDHETIDPSQRDRPPLNGTYHLSEKMSQLQASRTVDAALTPPFPFSASKRSGMEATNGSDATVKQEPIPSRSASPIDLDAPPLSLYDQLGLPNRTSGALRVPRPRFGKDETAKKESWSKEMADSIRWVRGREGINGPLIIGNVFWRPDGVSFDWKIPTEEVIPVQEDHPLRTVDSNVIPARQASGRSIPTARPSEIGVGGQAAADDTIPPAPTLLPSSGQTNPSPIRVKEEGPEISLLSSEPPTLSSGQTDTRPPRPFDNPPRNMIKAEILTPSLPRTPQSPDMSNINTPTLPATAQSLPINPAFESPDALSNIATCFLDRYMSVHARV